MKPTTSRFRVFSYEADWNASRLKEAQIVLTRQTKSLKSARKVSKSNTASNERAHGRIVFVCAPFKREYNAKRPPEARAKK